MPYPNPKEDGMTIADLRNKLDAIKYEIRLAEEFRDSLPDLYELKRAYQSTLIERETAEQMKVAVA